MQRVPTERITISYLILKLYLERSIPVSSSIKIVIGGNDGRTLKVNGTTIATNVGSAVQTITNQSTLNKIEVVAESSARSGRLADIKVDDVSLLLPVLPFGRNINPSELSPGLLTDKVIDGGNSAIKGSVEFGENDYLTLTPSTDFNFGTGDFTIEFWIHPQKRFTSYPNIFVINDSVNASKLYINFRNGANLALTDATTVFAQTGPFNLDDWFHVALVRTSGQSRLYMNGIGGSSVSCTNNFGGSNDGMVYIGFEQNQNSVNKYNGFISNFRIVKGTALYTHDFIPPTRELKKIPGTVLLCCQDPDNPLTEAIGKTITGYGHFDRVDVGEDLITNGHFTSNTDNWTANGSTLPTLTVDSGRLKLTHNGANGGAYQNITTVVGSTYDFSAILTDGNSSGVRLRVYGDGATGDGFQGTNYIGDVVRMQHQH